MATDPLVDFKTLFKLLLAEHNLTNLILMTAFSSNLDADAARASLPTIYN